MEVRRAVAADAPELARLLMQADAALTTDEAELRLEALREHADCAVLVAAGYSGLNGVAALHWAPTLQQPRPTARITALVVDEEERRHGIGRLLLKAASQVARSAGCDTLEVAVEDGQNSLAAFCRSTGFAQGGTLFGRSLRKRKTEG